MMNLSNYLPAPESHEQRPDISSLVDDSNLVNTLLEDRLNVLSLLLQDLRSEMVLRITLKDSLIERIDERMCYLTTRFYELDPLQGSRNTEKLRNSVIQQLEGLEREKRDRATEGWRDIAVLKKEFRVSYKEFRDVLRRAKIVLQGAKK